ncbi:MAG: GGDEF domain-containing protein [Oleiphilaceae bacterium]|nr:GGDEF domain-containing protein [Oleiphilaceae bacterium]
MADLLVANFSGAQLMVYEVHAARIDHSKSPCLICSDCLSIEEPIYLNDDQELEEAYNTKSIQKQSVNAHETSIVIPVVLYDQTISHLIRVTHPYPSGTAAEVLEGLMSICGDIFRSLHEKGYDPLTRILNRQAFDQVASSLAYSQPRNNVDTNGAQKKSFKSIAIMDIDHFKQINDHYGHAIGDETLVLFSQTVRSVLRQEDLFFRYGGEEFVVLVKDVDFDQAQTVLERCREAIAGRRFPQVGQVTVSIGFTDLEPQSHPVESLTKADKALYFAKQNGRNQVASYEQLVEANLLEPVEPIQSHADFWDDE